MYAPLLGFLIAPLGIGSRQERPLMGTSAGKDLPFVTVVKEIEAVQLQSQRRRECPSGDRRTLRR